MIYQGYEPPPGGGRIRRLFKDLKGKWPWSVRAACGLTGYLLWVFIDTELRQKGAPASWPGDWLTLYGIVPVVLACVATIQMLFIRTPFFLRFGVLYALAVASVLATAEWEELTGVGPRLEGEARRAASRETYVEARYSALVDAYVVQDYALMSRLANEFLAAFGDYKDARSYAQTADRRLRAQRMVSHAEARQERVEFLRRQVASLTETAGPLEARAARDPAAASELRALASDIRRVDPMNWQASEWLRLLDRAPASR